MQLEHLNFELAILEPRLSCIHKQSKETKQCHHKKMKPCLCHAVTYLVNDLMPMYRIDY
ncbi:hypothetical protein VP121E341_P0019 [Vibrio phage 121E34-1]|nr:hypothetical protein VP121E341_P0019 [Vibrio phage 121E34-1]CAH9011716.1 hypothetical protein VP131E341_P0019 [Vibrio phage 131E34-1]